MARLISWAESGSSEGRAVVSEIYPKTGRAHIIGITGVPGSGKSSLVRGLVQEYRESGKTVGIIAIDPSSPFSRGAILGDRIRMLDISSDPGVFIRSMATRGALGGLSNAVHDAVDILDAAGFDLVIVETVGVGQDEIDIVQASHTTVVVSAPGLGDEIQALKAGILEIADIHVVSKADRPESAKTVAELKEMLMLGHPAGKNPRWQPSVTPVSNFSGEGLSVLAKQIMQHRSYLEESKEIRERARRLIECRILKLAEGMMRQKFLSDDQLGVSDLINRAVKREITPFMAAMILLGKKKEIG